MNMNRSDAISGVLVADAAAMGLHWLYDQEHIKLVECTGDVLFRQPDHAVYQGQRGFFAHPGKLAGELSHYGESARLLAQLVESQAYDTHAHQQRFMATFGPCGSYRGYADRPTKALIARIIQDGEDLPARSGMDDNQMPAFAVVGALFAAEYDLPSIEAAAAVISTNSDVIDGVRVAANCLKLLMDGAELDDALARSAAVAEGGLKTLLSEALSMESYQPLEASTHFGLACYVHHSLPVVWHLLKHASSFESVVRDNIRCGGDSCGRAMVLGAIAGLVFEVPEGMRSRVRIG
jgi:hypothetical protein